MIATSDAKMAVPLHLFPCPRPCPRPQMKELEEGMDKLENELTILLLPRDPADDKNGAIRVRVRFGVRIRVRILSRIRIKDTEDGALMKNEKAHTLLPPCPLPLYFTHIHTCTNR